MARLRRSRTLDQADLTNWIEYTKLVMPLRGRARPAAATAVEPPATAAPAEPAPAVAATVAAGPRKLARGAEVEIGLAPGGVDKASWRRLSRGQLAPDRTLDLHGRTVQRAYIALQTFIVSAQADGLRCVEVITGRGLVDGTTGAIRRELPHWLNQHPLRGMILGAAHPHPANTGAVRLLLRRSR